jgi:DNA-binding SARP family transcriptional activator
MASTQAAARGRQLEAADLWVDVDAFDQAVDGDDLQGAIALYTGDLLLEDRFEPWTEPRREQLRVRHERVLLDWSRELAARDDLRTSMSTLERLVELDPLHEEAHADLIRVLARSGQHRLAVQAYERLAARLRTDLPGVRA